MAWEKRGPQLLIGIPHTGEVTMEWALAFKQLIVPMPFLMTFQRGQPLDLARNAIVEEALRNEVEWLFFLDSDVILEPDALQRLLSHNLPIVSALYYRRHPSIGPAGPIMQPVPAAWRYAPEEVRKPGALFTPIMDPPAQLFEADVIGMGACLIHTSVFKRLKPPWFKWTAGWGKYGLADPWEEMSEDFYFCIRAKKELGLKIMVDGSVRARHCYTGVVDEYGRISFHRV
ncbi:MAG: hypothetical protein DRO09_00145 [Thermoprotei archaeon]|nr:MAG: hypothetical protein DRO09_00145 [Thermoprotei archaeon]